MSSKQTKKQSKNVKAKVIVSKATSAPVRHPSEVVTFVEKKAGGRQRPVVSNVSNPYARTLLNPEFEENFGIPDQFNQPSHKFTTITNAAIPVGPNGEFSVLVQPDMANSWYVAYQATQVKQLTILNAKANLFGTSSVGGGLDTEVTDFRGTFLYDCDGFYTVQLGQTAVLWAASRGQPLAVAGPTQILLPASAPSQIAGLIPVTDCGFLVVGKGESFAANNIEVRFYAVDASGNPLATVGGTVDFSAGFMQQFISPAFTTPDAAYLTRIEVIPTLGGSIFDSLSIGIVSTAVHPSLANYLLEANSVSDFETYERDFIAVRPVGCSALMTYRGKALEGGFIAARRFQGVESPCNTSGPALPYSVLASRPGSYDGAVNTGAYTFWLPQDVTASIFRPVSSPRDDFTYGYLAIGGALTDPNPSSLRLRVATAWEGITYKQMYHLSTSTVDPDMITHALKTLSGLPSAMENDLHWSTIADYLKKGVKKGAEMIWSQRVPVAEAASRAAGLSPAATQAIGRILGSI